MEKYQELYVKYQGILEKIIGEIDGMGLNPKEQDQQNELILAKIERNVVDIFNKMLKITYDNIYVRDNGPKDNKERQFQLAYMAMFDKITEPWVVKAEKDKKFGKLDEYEKEEVKLKKAEEIKTLFNTTFKEIYGE